MRSGHTPYLGGVAPARIQQGFSKEQSIDNYRTGLEYCPPLGVVWHKHPVTILQFSSRIPAGTKPWSSSSLLRYTHEQQVLHTLFGFIARRRLFAAGCLRFIYLCAPRSCFHDEYTSTHTRDSLGACVYSQ